MIRPVNRSLCDIHKDTLKIIFNLLVHKTCVSNVGRVGSTCKTLHAISCKVLLERVLEWDPSFSWVGHIIPGQIEEVDFERSTMRIPRSSFESLVRVDDIDWLLDKAIVPCEKSPSSHSIDDDLIHVILHSNLITVGSNFVDAIVNRLLLVRSKDDNGSDIHKDVFDIRFFEILSTMLKMKLITKEAPCFVDMVNTIIAEKGFIHWRICLLKLVFNQGLLAEDAKYFADVLEEAESVIHTISKLSEDTELKRSLLKICKISKFFQNIILPKFNIPIATAIVRELFVQLYPEDCNLNLFKMIIDSEPLKSSECCQAIIKELQDAPNLLHEFYKDLEIRKKGIQELLDYVRNKE